MSISATAAATGALEGGSYDVWSAIDCFIRVAKGSAVSPDDAASVTTSNGYKIYADNVVAVQVDHGDKIGVIAGGAGTFNFHKTAE